MQKSLLKKTWLSAGLLLTILALGCDQFPPEPIPCEIPGLTDLNVLDEASQIACDYAHKISEADRLLDDFKGEQAHKVYKEALALAAEVTVVTKGRPVFAQDGVTPLSDLDLACRPAYGIMLAHIQQLLHFVNVQLSAIVPLIPGLGGSPSLTSGKFRPAQGIDFDTELGQFIVNFYEADFKEEFDGIAAAHELLETMPDCEYVATNDHLLSFNPKAFVSPGFPIRLVSNDGPDSREVQNDPESIAIEIRTGAHWDLTEARIIRFLIELIRASLFSVMAHDLTFDEEQVLQTTEWIFDIANDGRDLLDLLECTGIGVNHPLWGSDISESLENSASDNKDPDRVNGHVDTPSECLLAVAAISDPLTLTKHFRKLGFLADNPATFTRHSVRWDRYMPLVDNALGAGFSGASLIVEGLVRRTLRYSTNIRADETLSTFSFLFEDNDDNGDLTRGDKIGFNLLDLRIKLSESILEDQGISQETLDTTIDNLGFIIEGVLIQEVPDDDFVDNLQQVVDILRDQFLSVDDPSIETQLFSIASLQPVISGTGFFGEDPIPDVFAFDFGGGFREVSDGTNRSPAPLRDLLPYWEVTEGTTPQGGTASVPVNEFIIEEELKFGESSIFPWQNTVDTSISGGSDNGDAFHFTPGDGTYSYYDAKNFSVAVNERNVPWDTSFERLDNDCDSPEDNPDSDFFQGFLGVKQGLMYFYFQDPTFSNTLYVKTNTIKACVNDSRHPGQSDYELADLYTLHRGAIATVGWFNKNFTISELLGALQGF